MVRSPFLKRLDEACELSRSLVCVGLDPDPELMPLSNVFEFNRAIVDATADLVCAYKPNLAFYEAMGIDGLKGLRDTISYIKERAPHAILIGDGKRGDIGSSAKAYARAMFEVWGFDVTTAVPYLGEDALEPLLKYEDRGVFVLCRTSNPGSREFQDLAVVSGSEKSPLYQHVAKASSGWNRRGNVGLVVGATYPEELRCVRELCPNMPFLIPGVGAQGGDLEGAVRYGTDEKGRSAIINSSRAVIYASRGPDFAEASRQETLKLRDRINHILEGEGKGLN